MTDVRSPAWKVLAAAPMPEAEFWQLVDKLGWRKGADSKAIKKQVMKLLPTYEECESARAAMRKLEGQLYGVITKYEKANDVSAGLGDDSFGDLIAHIIGLGKGEFEASVKDPRRAIERGKKGDYTESFAYCFPYEDDYKKQGNVGAFKEWAQRNQKNYRAVLKIPFYREIHDDAKVIIEAMGKIIAGDVQGFLDTQGPVEQALKNIDQHVEKLREMLSEFDSSPWGVKNMYGDVKESLQ